MRRTIAIAALRWPLGTVAALLLLLMVLSVAAVQPAPSAHGQNPAERTWRLAGIYIAETSGSPERLNYPRFMTIRSANSQGGFGDIEVKNRAGQPLFRQRFSWRFPGDISVIKSGNSVTQGLQFILEGERTTINANGVSLNGDGSGSNFPNVYMPPERAARFAGAVGIPVQSSANGNVIELGNNPTAPTSAMGSFYIPNSPPLSGPQWAAFWFTVTLHNGDGNSSIQFYEIHYVFTNDGAPAGLLPGASELPPGVTFFPPTSITPQPPSPPRPPIGAGNGNFSRPMVNGVDVDWCLEFGRQCGAPAADRFCLAQGFARSNGSTMVLTDRTIILGSNSLCQSPGRCGALRDVQCTGASAPPTTLPPRPPSPPPNMAPVALKLYYGDAREDNFTTGTALGEQSALQAGYRFVRIEGYGYASPQPGLVPLKLYWHPGRGDNFSTATAEGERAALASGYQFARIEAYIYPTQVPGTVPLVNYWSAARGDNFGTATAIGIRDAAAANYSYAWVEGYVLPVQ